MPGIPQIWYLDIFAGKNNYKAADLAGSGGHKEINRTTLSLSDIKKGLKEEIVLNQLKLIKLRNNSEAFQGDLKISDTSENQIDMTWSKNGHSAQLKANIETFRFTIISKEGDQHKTWSF